MGEFAGWSLPIVYTTVAEEASAVRRTAGLFDVSHMGELVLRGPDAPADLDRLFPSNIGSLEVGRGCYSLVLQEDGGILDDLFLYRIESSTFLCVVNAATTPSDFRWLSEHLQGAGTTVTDASEHWGALAVQGPEARKIVRSILPEVPEALGRRAIVVASWEGTRLWVARTGYTGEDGVELFFPVPLGPGLWEAILEAGASSGIRPCGLAARDILRLEACLPLSGQELTPEVTPVEAGLAWVVDWEKRCSFPGRRALEERRIRGAEVLLVAFVVDPPAPPPRTGYELRSGETVVGKVTSGGFSPTLRAPIGMGYVRTELAAQGTRLAYTVRGHRYEATVRAAPLYRRRRR
ncbi:Aminomethyltransferase [Methylacidimicrobium sp. AP8]|nr:Aminomethyltransferase [Methylacidimicrobium sp. AP8]